MPEARTPLTSRRRWIRVLLIWAAALLLIGLIGCVVLYRYLAVYEITRPEIWMDQLMETMDRDDFLREAAQNLDFELTEFEDADALFASYAEAIPEDADLSYTSSKGRTGRDSAVFVVRAGPVSVCTVELVPGDKHFAFGRHDWTLGRISSGDITEKLQSASVQINALSEQSLRINGVPVTADYLTADDTPIKGLSELEKRFDEVPHLVTYTVGPLYGEISVTDADGKEYFPSDDEEGSVYDACPAGSGRLYITAPADVVVSVGGARLGKSDITETGPGVLRDAERYLPEGGYGTVTYRFDGLYTDPEVTAVDADGNPLTPIRVGESRYAFYHANDPKVQDSLQSVAESYFDYYLSYTLLPFDGTYYFALLQKTLWSSELYSYIASSQQAMLWAAQTSPEIRTLRYDNFRMVGEDCFVCTVEYDIDMTAYTWDNELQSYRLQNAFELCFVRENNNWFAAAMDAVTE